jgi:hypothetical protein
VPGANAWKPHHRRLFDGIERVLVIGDNDKAGQGFAARVLHDLHSGVGVTLDQSINDMNELLVSGGVDGVREALAV